MFQKEFFYLIKVEYLGFRYHGWATQPNVKTVQGMIQKTIRFVLGNEVKFKVLGASRTDAMVSARGAYFELFLFQEIDERSFLTEFNYNLPQDIMAKSIKKIDKNFNIIQSVKQKEYNYYFTKYDMHPFASPFMTFVPDNLDIDLMIKSAALFEGEFNFSNYCEQPGKETNTIRNIEKCQIRVNNEFSSHFFPQNSWVLDVRGRGFLRKQIRLMMGALIQVGKGDLVPSQIRESLNGGNAHPKYVAPASGLILRDIIFEDE